MSIESDVLREIDFTVISDFAVAKSKRCLVFYFRLCGFVWELQVHVYYTDNNIIIILLVLNNAFSYLLVLYF